MEHLEEIFNRIDFSSLIMCYAARSSGHIFLAAVADLFVGHGPTIGNLTHTRWRCVSTRQRIFALARVLHETPEESKGVGRV